MIAAGFFGDFHFSGLLMNKKKDLSDNIFSICHAPLSLPYTQNLYLTNSIRLKS
jgi:hypothetical protein